MIKQLYLLLVSALIPALDCGQAVAGGDSEYGEYLSSECTTCHQPKAVSATIPSLNGMDEGGFVQIMKLYREKKLENPTMRTVAGRLTDEDIAALAAYYSALPTPD